MLKVAVIRSTGIPPGKKREGRRRKRTVAAKKGMPRVSKKNLMGKKALRKKKKCRTKEPKVKGGLKHEIFFPNSGQRMGGGVV